MFFVNQLTGFGAFTEEAGGGNDAYTVVLLHCDGADGSTTVTNSAVGGSTTFTAAGNAHIEVDQSKFGGASLHLDGTGDSVTFDGSSADFTWAGDFTIDFWLYSTDQGLEGSAVRRIFGMGTGATNVQVWIDNTTGQLHFATGAGTTIANSTTDVSDSTWRHIEISRSGTTLKIFVGGTQEASVSNSTTWAGNATSYIGRYQGSGIGHYVGYLDEIRFSKGIARHTAGFTPPTAAYS